MTNLPRSDFPAGVTELDSFLRQVAESAQLLSGASGAAIAIRNGSDRNGEEVLCLARSGDTAPPLGSRIDVHSGISGECLITGSLLHCDDAAADVRVDPEVCRELGLRSIVVLPVRGQSRIAGILEVFSTQPHAFTGEHIDSLKGLAEMIEMACASRSVDALRPPSPATPPAIPSHYQLPFSVSLLKDRRSYWIAGGALAMLLVFAIAGVRAFQSRGTHERAASVAQSAVKPGLPETAEIVLQPSGENSDRQNKRKRLSPTDERRGLQQASQVEALSPRGGTSRNDPGLLKSASATENRLQLPGVENETSAPALSLAANSTAPEGLLIPSVTLPKLAVSQGISGGVLDYRVNPVYPPEALSRRLEGEVVLQATITKTGQVRDLKLTKGNPLLGRAAMDAVKQWHYRPYRLNGEALESQTEIRVNFHAQ